MAEIQVKAIPMALAQRCWSSSCLPGKVCVSWPTSYPERQGKDAHTLCKLLSAWDSPSLKHFTEPHASPSPCKRNTVASPGSLSSASIHCGKFKYCPLWLCCLWRLVIFSLPHLPPRGSPALQILPSHWPSSLCPQGQALHPGPSHAEGWASAGAGWMLPMDW